jgi:hypothetical protein
MLRIRYSRFTHHVRRGGGATLHGSQPRREARPTRDRQRPGPEWSPNGYPSLTARWVKRASRQPAGSWRRAPADRPRADRRAQHGQAVPRIGRLPARIQRETGFSAEWARPSVIRGGVYRLAALPRGGADAAVHGRDGASARRPARCRRSPTATGRPRITTPIRSLRLNVTRGIVLSFTTRLVNTATARGDHDEHSGRRAKPELALFRHSHSSPPSGPTFQTHA